jgi:hypothetical protein
MITGAQIRAARRLLNLEANALAKLPLGVITRAENVDDEPIITMAQARAIQHALEAVGVEFTNGDQPGIRLARKAPATGKAE